MKRTVGRIKTHGFALPTVMIASVVMLMVLLSGLVAASSVSSSLRSQYYNKLAAEAAESGINYIKACISSGQTPTTNSLYYVNSTSCSNPAASTDPARSANLLQYDATKNTLRMNTYYTVKVTSSANNVYTIYSTGYIDYLNTAGQVVRTESNRGIYSRQTAPIYGIQSGNDTTCAINVGKLYCWGINDWGQVGDGTKTNRLYPVLIEGQLAGKIVTAVATGIAHTCATAHGYNETDVDNKLYCWGDNTRAQYGSGATSAGSLTPVIAIDSNRNGIADPNDGTVSGKYITAVSARDHTCVIAKTVNTTTSNAYCWGKNDTTQAGENTASGAPVITDPKLTPGAAIRQNDLNSSQLAAVIKISNVSSEFACSINGSQVYCWGSTAMGQGGANDTVGRSDGRAVAANGVSGDATDNMSSATQIYINFGKACAINSGALWCWGSNGYAAGNIKDFRLDSGSNFNQVVQNGYPKMPINDITSPVYGKTVTDVALADSANCVLIAGKVYCWGYNNQGQLGLGNTFGPDNATQSVMRSSTVQYAPSQVRSANQMGEVRGELTGQIVTDIAAGNSHFCALTSTKRTYCWGNNSRGQVGNGTTLDVLSPVEVKLPNSVNSY